MAPHVWDSSRRKKWTKIDDEDYVVPYEMRQKQTFKGRSAHNSAKAIKPM